MKILSHINYFPAYCFQVSNSGNVPTLIIRLLLCMFLHSGRSLHFFHMSASAVTNKNHKALNAACFLIKHYEDKAKSDAFRLLHIAFIQQQAPHECLKLKQENYHWIINYPQHEDGLDQITTVNTATCHRCWCMHTCEPTADLNITCSFVPTRENKLLYTLNEIILLVSRSSEEIMQGNQYQTLSMCYWWERSRIMQSA